MTIEAGWLAGRLREERERRGLTREQLAKLAGVSANAIAQWERSEREPSWSNVLALTKALGVDCTVFTTAPEEREPPGPGRPRKPEVEQPPPPAEPKKKGRPKKQ